MTSAQPTAIASSYIPTLDGWRAIAILLVLIDHTIFQTFRPYGWTLIGGHGVEIFFILSGYLITGKLLEDGSLGRFYTRRVFRILPILFVYLTVVGVLGFGLHRIPLLRSEMASAALFARNFVVYPKATATGAGEFTAHLWSLSIEEQFYLLWPLVLLKVGRGTDRRRILSAILLLGFWATVFVLVHVARLAHLWGWSWIPHLNFVGLVTGCVLRIGLSNKRGESVARGVVAGRSGLMVGTLLAYILVFHTRITILDPLLCGLAVCATILQPNSRMGRFLELPALRWIGRLSYSLYIWQQVFLGFGVVYRPFGILSKFPVNLAATVLVACASYYLLEKPMMRWGQELSAGRRPVLRAMSASAAA